MKRWLQMWSGTTSAPRSVSSGRDTISTRPVCIQVQTGAVECLILGVVDRTNALPQAGMKPGSGRSCTGLVTTDYSMPHLHAALICGWPHSLLTQVIP